MTGGIRQARPVPGYRPKCRAARPRCPSCGVTMEPGETGLAICPVCGGRLYQYRSESRSMSE